MEIQEKNVGDVRLVEKVDIKELTGRAADIIAWLYDNPHADVRLFESNARALNALRIRISNYYKTNKI